MDWLTCVLMMFGPTTLGTTPSAPIPIVGGTDAASCQFPSVVSILEGDETPVMCSGTLIHPEVVLTAAHCINPARPVVGIGFGEEGQGAVGPQRVVIPTTCVPNPEYEQQFVGDVAYCRLQTPVTDVPIVPILSGCEADALVPGTTVTIVGYGSNFGMLDDLGELQVEGVGPKRFTTQTIDFVDDVIEEVNMVGPNGSQSACFGDSGGPAFVQLADGSWRVFGTGSHLYDPGGLPDPVLPGNLCGAGVAYGLATSSIAWLESETGVDLTPCHDASGQWDPGPDCGAFPTAPDIAFGDWAGGCAGGPVAGTEPACEAVGETGGTDDAGTDDAGTMGGATTGPGPATTTTRGGGSTTMLPTPGDGDGTGSDAGETAGQTAGQTDGDDGCGCRSDARPRWGARAGVLGLLVVVAGRRGRSSARR